METGFGEYLLFDDLGQPLYTTCPEEPAQPIERMQTRMFNWRGNEGSQTDMMHEDIADHQTFQLYEPGQTEETLAEDDAQRWPAYTRPSTGLIYMQARYYNPETGRFTQADPMPYDVGQLMNGQNNRWVYCGNDPVNLTDPLGLFIGVVCLAIIALVFFIFALIFWFLNMQYMRAARACNSNISQDWEDLAFDMGWYGNGCAIFGSLFSIAAGGPGFLALWETIKSGFLSFLGLPVAVWDGLIRFFGEVFCLD